MHWKDELGIRSDFGPALLKLTCKVCRQTFLAIRKHIRNLEAASWPKCLMTAAGTAALMSRFYLRGTRLELNCFNMYPLRDSCSLPMFLKRIQTLQGLSQGLGFRFGYSAGHDVRSDISVSCDCRFSKP
jgi:hypothetical protein